MKEHHPPPICSKRIRILCQMGLIVVSLIPLVVKDVFADVPTNRESSRPKILFAKNTQGNKMLGNTNLYETIFKRKSIREYDLTPLDGHTLEEIMAHTSTLKPLYDDIKIERVWFYRWDAIAEEYLDIGNVHNYPYSINLDATKLNFGFNQIFVRAYDVASNYSDRQHIWIYRDTFYQYMPLVFP